MSLVSQKLSKLRVFSWFPFLCINIYFTFYLCFLFTCWGWSRVVVQLHDVRSREVVTLMGARGWGAGDTWPARRRVSHARLGCTQRASSPMRCTLGCSGRRTSQSLSPNLRLFLSVEKFLATFSALYHRANLNLSNPKF